ncbi:Methyl-accepting chemotaxis protein, partial [Pseudomonas cichorii]
MRLSLKAKVLSLAVLPVLLFAVVISVTTVFILHQQADREVSETRERLLTEARATLKSYVDIALSGIKPIYEASAQGDNAARASAVKLLSAVSYGKDGYLFGYDSEIIRIFRSNSSDGLGKSFKEVRDPSGVYLNRELVASAKTGDHYTYYASPLPGKTEPVPKVAYTEYLPKWDLVVGSSVNLENVEAQVAVVKQNVEARLYDMLYSIVGITVLVLVIISVIGIVMTGTLLRPLRLMKDNLDDIVAGEGDLTRRLAITSQDELGELAGSFNRFVDKIHGIVRQITEMTTQLTGLVSEVSDQAQRSELAMDRQRHETD